MFKTRSLDKEWMDLGLSHYSLDQYRDCLVQLNNVGKYLGGDQATFNSLKVLKKVPKSIADIGCGGGFITSKLARLYPNAKVTGIDIDKEAILFANENNKQPNCNFFFNETTDYLDKNYDLISTCLVCHHFTDEQIIAFLKEAYQKANHAIIINDLQRSVLAWVLFGLISPILFQNKMITHDGLLSIKKSFTRKDWLNYLQKAHIPKNQITLKWHWAFRWVLTIEKE